MDSDSIVNKRYQMTQFFKNNQIDALTLRKNGKMDNENNRCDEF